MAVPPWGVSSLAAAAGVLALAADGVPAGWALAQQAVESVADAGRVMLPACILAVSKGARRAAVHQNLVGLGFRS